MNRRNLIKGISASLAFIFFVSPLANASALKCDVCGMPIGLHGRNHIVLLETSGKKTLHVCSPICARKIRKYDATYSKVEVTDFNHPENKLQGNKAYFLIQSSKSSGRMFCLQKKIKKRV